MDFSISSTVALLPSGFELSTYSLWTCVTLGEKVNTGLMLLYLCLSSGASLSSYVCFIFASSSSSLAASTSLSLPLFLCHFVILVSVRGDVVGKFSSSSQSPRCTPPKIQSLEISSGCGINPL